jgi:MYXO-CTERM domain-containing protein
MSATADPQDSTDVGAAQGHHHSGGADAGWRCAFLAVAVLAAVTWFR